MKPDRPAAMEAARRVVAADDNNSLVWSSTRTTVLLARALLASEPDPRVAAMRAVILKMTGALEGLYAMVRGESPSLLEDNCTAESAQEAIDNGNAFLASPPEPLRDGWRPIDSAPKDGRHVLLRWGQTVTEGWWALPFESALLEQCFWRTFAAGDMRPERPTQWQPLPVPPASPPQEPR